MLPWIKEAINEVCRQRGVYPHHIEQWRRDFLAPSAHHSAKSDALELKKLKHEFSLTKKELNRKNKALAEVAALLVFQKKSMRCGAATRTSHDE